MLLAVFTTCIAVALAAPVVVPDNGVPEMHNLDDVHAYLKTLTPSQIDYFSKFPCTQKILFELTECLRQKPVTECSHGSLYVPVFANLWDLKQFLEARNNEELKYYNSFSCTKKLCADLTVCLKTKPVPEVIVPYCKELKCLKAWLNARTPEQLEYYSSFPCTQKILSEFTTCLQTKPIKENNSDKILVVPHFKHLYELKDFLNHRCDSELTFYSEFTCTQKLLVDMTDCLSSKHCPENTMVFVPHFTDLEVLRAWLNARTQTQLDYYSKFPCAQKIMLDYTECLKTKPIKENDDKTILAIPTFTHLCTLKDFLNKRTKKELDFYSSFPCTQKLNVELHECLKTKPCTTATIQEAALESIIEAAVINSLVNVPHFNSLHDVKAFLIGLRPDQIEYYSQFPCAQTLVKQLHDCLATKPCLK